MKETIHHYCEDRSKVEQVATISANDDSEVGKLIEEAMSKAGKESVITLEEAKGMETKSISKGHPVETTRRYWKKSSQIFLCKLKT